MTRQTILDERVVPAEQSARIAPVPATAGIIYTLAWIAGLSVSSSSTDVRSGGAAVVTALTGHEAATVTQFVLTEGVASLALAIVAVGLGRAGRQAGSAALGRLITGTGLAAAAIAIVQCILGVTLAVSTVPAGRAGDAATINDTINRLDGLKMLILAAMAIAGTVLARRTGVLPAWLRWIGAALAVTIIASGVGYALLNNELAIAAWASLPLLLVFVTGTGLVLRRRPRTAAAGHTAQR